MEKNILIFCANPKPDSFSWALAQQYEKAAKKAGAKVILYNLINVDFNYNLTPQNKLEEYTESDLLKIRKKIIEADHLVFVYPNWWGTFPALLKAFIDRVFINGFAYEYVKNKPLPKPLLKNKTARLIVTMDTPKWYYKLIYHQPGHYAMKKSTLEFCGIKPVKITTFSPIRNSSELQRKKYLRKTNELGQKMI